MSNRLVRTTKSAALLSFALVALGTCLQVGCSLVPSDDDATTEDSVSGSHPYGYGYYGHSGYAGYHGYP